MAQLGRVLFVVCAIVGALASCSKRPPPPLPLTDIEVGELSVKASIPSGWVVLRNGPITVVRSPPGTSTVQVMTITGTTGKLPGEVEFRDVGPVAAEGATGASEFARLVDANWRRSHSDGPGSEIVSRKQLQIDKRAAEEIVVAERGWRSRRLLVVDQGRLLVIRVPEGFESSVAAYEGIRASLAFR